jgi:uncharacterized protein
MWVQRLHHHVIKKVFVVTFVDDYVAIKEWTQLMKMKWKHHKLFKKEKLSQ